ncbi:MAG: hypothetical protein LBP32_06300 [Spirochaetaceae bacterium]|jgi:ligand-binding SRPBCC domain-containing protein|nr:hypothetical protein [Spirochaetaceae bacterium]
MKQTKIIRVSSTFPAPPDELWPLLLRVDTLRYIAAPYAAFSPLEPGEMVWREGTAVRFHLRIFGLPFGIHTIRIHKIDGIAHTIQTYEGNQFVPVWNHRITLEPADGISTIYTDEVEIGAGWKTGVVRLWSGAFYRHRQRKWLKLMGRSHPGSPP